MEFKKDIIDDSYEFLELLKEKLTNEMQAASRIRFESKEQEMELGLEIVAFLKQTLEFYDKVNQSYEEVIENPNKPDMVNHPNHYTMGQYEVIDVIKDWLTEEEFRGYIKGNALKYVSRERLKNGDEDLKKTIFYLNYLVNGKKSDRSE